MKTCVWCNKEKPLGEFHKRSAAKDGYDNRCKDCISRYKKEQRDKRSSEQKERHRESVRRWRANNPDKVKLSDKKQNLKRFSLSLEEYKDRLSEQGGVCAICKSEPQDNRSLAVDHDHQCCSVNGSCGKCLRGLLCWRCNMVLGLVEDDTNLINSMLKYIEDYR